MVAAVAGFLLLLGITQYLAYHTHGVAREREMEDLQNELNETKSRFKDILDRSISSANTIAILYKQYGKPEHFDSVAKLLMDFERTIDMINITDRYVISHVFPLEGNEMILGKSLLGGLKRRWR